MTRFLAKLWFIAIIGYAFALPFSLTVSWAFLIAGIVALCLEAGLSYFQPTERAKPKEIFNIAFHWSYIAAPLFAFMLALFLSGLVNGGIKEAFLSMLTIKPFIVYFIALFAFTKNASWRNLTISIMLSIGAVAGVFACLQQIFNFHPFTYQYLQGTGFLRDPMSFAGQMQVFTMLSLAYLLKGNYIYLVGPLKSKWLFSLVCAGNVLGIIFASERGAWLGFIAGLIVCLALVSRKALLLGSIILVSLLAISWCYIPVVQTRIAPLISGKPDVSTTARLRIWEEALSIYFKHPVLGVGPRNFPHFDINQAIVPGRSKDLCHGHSNYFHILATTGTIGIFCYLALVTGILYWCIYVYNHVFLWGNVEGLSAIALGLLAATVSILVSGAFEYNFGAATVRLTYWFCLALLPSLLPKSK